MRGQPHAACVCMTLEVCSLSRWLIISWWLYHRKTIETTSYIVHPHATFTSMNRLGCTNSMNFEVQTHGCMYYASKLQRECHMNHVLGALGIMMFLHSHSLLEVCIFLVPETETTIPSPCWFRFVSATNFVDGTILLVESEINISSPSN